MLSVTGQKVSLTMKDVCQETGKDLNPTSHAHLEVSMSSYKIKIIIGIVFHIYLSNIICQIHHQAEREGRNPDRPPPAATVLAGLQSGLDPDEDSSRKRVTRISSPERWEIKQVSKKEKLEARRFVAYNYG